MRGEGKEADMRGKGLPPPPPPTALMFASCIVRHARTCTQYIKCPLTLTPPANVWQCCQAKVPALHLHLFDNQDKLKVEEARNAPPTTISPQKPTVLPPSKGWGGKSSPPPAPLHSSIDDFPSLPGAPPTAAPPASAGSPLPSAPVQQQQQQHQQQQQQQALPPPPPQAVSSAVPPVVAGTAAAVPGSGGV